MHTGRRVGHVLLGSVALLLALVAAACVPEPPPEPAPPHVVVVYGDSLTAEASAELTARLSALLPDREIVIRAFSGTAQCDWHQSMQEDAAAFAVDAVAISFVGNTTTSCIRDRETLSAYATDASWAVDFWRDHGVPLVFVAGPGPAGRLPAEHLVGNVYRTVGIARGVPVVDPAPLFVDADSGEYAWEMPCLDGECDDVIPVRADDGVHFCPTGTAIPGGCSVYSSGVVRFAEVIVHGVASLLGVPQPPYRTMVTPTTTTTTTTVP